MANDPSVDVRQFILKQFPLARKKQINDSDPLLESGIIDSLGVLELVGFIDQKFSVTVQDEDLVPDNFQTIERVAAFIKRQIDHNGSLHP